MTENIRKEKKEENSLINNNAKSHHISNKGAIKLENILILLICIGDYSSSSNSSLIPLPGTQNDKKRLYNLFKHTYKYKIIQTSKSYVTYNDIENKLHETYIEFRDNPYDAIMVFFSGHGSDDSLITSDGDKYSRQRFECYFNNKQIPSKQASFRFYFIDACAGNTQSQLIKNKVNGNNDKSNPAIFSKGNDDLWIHPEDNKSIIYSNINEYLLLF